MIAAWMLQALGVGALCAAGALAVEWACRARRWPTRWAWVGAMALTLALVATAPLRRAAETVELSLPKVAVGARTVEVAAPSVLARAGAAVDAALAWLAMPLDRLARIGGEAPGAAPWLLGGWALLSAMLLLAAAAAAWRLARERRRWPVAELHGERVRLAPRFGPAVVGLARAGIVVPRWLLGCDAASQRLAIAHEREHVRARDPLLLALGGLVVIALPWHPVAWWMLARLRLAVELDCDRRVLGAGAAPAEYGALLIDVAGRGTGAPFTMPMLGIPALAERATHLERRLVAMTTPRARHAGTRLALALGLTLAAVLAACESTLPTTAEVEQMDVAQTERRLKVRDDSTVRYYVDGRQVTASEARAVPAESITTVRVMRADQGDGANEIRVETGMQRAGAPRAKVAVSSLSSESRERRFDGLVFIDGVLATSATMNALPPDRIATIDVIKGETAKALYPDDPAAAHGVIRITTKGAAKR